MTDIQTFDALTDQITKQHPFVRKLKQDGADPESNTRAVRKGVKKKAEEIGSADEFNQQDFDQFVRRKMFVVPSFGIHGGVRGLVDLGPPACALKGAIIHLWRKHFVLSESMLEMECTCLTPGAVLNISGPVQPYTDLMVRDPETGECFRADKLLEKAIDDVITSNPVMSKEERERHLHVQRQADAYKPEELDALLTKYECKAPSGQPYSPSFPVNLMFKTTIGPEGTAVGYLRPDTAQGLFVNFRRLLDQNAGKMPFAAAQIGLGFRNEITPRVGLLRAREFCMGEIEHFFNPDDKSHPNFQSIADKELVLCGRVDKLGAGKMKVMTASEAVQIGLIDSETLAYFMARTQLFMERIGMDPSRLRFRQRLMTEMAHYTADCWDLEIQSSHGWVKCVSHADRACYDLQQHSKATKAPMIATLNLDEPREIEFAKLELDWEVIGEHFKQDRRVVVSALETLAKDWVNFEKIATDLEKEGKTIVDDFEVTKEMLTWTKTKKNVHNIKFAPAVIGVSFGIGRILHSLLEHSFYKRDVEKEWYVMRFNPQVAPHKCAVLPISSGPTTNALVDEIAAELMENDLSTLVDKSTASPCELHARADEMGVPFAVSVDFQTLADDTVTLRERDSMIQIRLPTADVTKEIFDLVHRKITWRKVMEKYPIVQEMEENKKGEKKVVVDKLAKTVVEGTKRGRFSRPAPKN